MTRVMGSPTKGALIFGNFFWMLGDGGLHYQEKVIKAACPKFCRYIATVHEVVFFWDDMRHPPPPACTPKFQLRPV